MGIHAYTQRCRGLCALRHKGVAVELVSFFCSKQTVVRFQRSIEMGGEGHSPHHFHVFSIVRICVCACVCECVYVFVRVNLTARSQDVARTSTTHSISLLSHFTLHTSQTTQHSRYSTFVANNTGNTAINTHKPHSIHTTNIQYKRPTVNMYYIQYK